MKTFIQTLSAYLPHRLRPAVKELYWSTLIYNLSLAMVLIFEPVYLYQRGVPLVQIMLFYAAVYVFYLLLLPLGALMANRQGYEHSMFYGSFFQVAYYAALLFLPLSGGWLFLAIPLLYAIQKSLYWPAYHANFAQYADPTEEGREVGAIFAAGAIMYIIGPIVGGLLTAYYGFGVLFSVVSALVVFSNWPMLRTKEVFQPGGFSWVASFKRLFDRANRRVLLGVMGYGEELLVLTVWPIFIFAVLQSDASRLGSLITFSTLATTVITLIIGKRTDKAGSAGEVLSDRRRLLRFGALSYAAAWIGRAFVQSPISIFAVETWSRVSKDTLSVPLVAIDYDQAKRTTALEGVTLYEMSLIVGKILAALVAALLFYFFPGSYSVAFLLGAAFSLMYLIL